MQRNAPPPPRRRGPCPCGSGRRYKDCHGALNPDALLGSAADLRARGEFEAARQAVEAAVLAAPDDAVVLSAQGLLRQDFRDPRGAIESFDAAIGRAPDYADAHYNRAVALLMLGDYARGWPEYDWRTRVHDYADYARYDFGMPRWRAEPLAGKRILVHAEQGFGDTIQGVRFLKRLAREGATIDVFCQPALAALLGRVEGVASAFSNMAERPTHDFHAPVLDVAARYLPDISASHWEGPYLKPLPERVERFTRALESIPRPRIGFAWKGSAKMAEDRARSLTPAQAASLVTPQASFVSLQLGEPPLPAPVLDLSSSLRDWDDTLAAMSQLDLVLAVDSAVAHVAGALGRPTWVLVRYAADWRWGLEGETTPWYPGMRLFRQRERGDWTPVLDEVRAAYGSIVGAGR